MLFGAPFDGTTSFRPGTRFGSSAIRNESFGLETYSPYQDKDLCEIAVFDGGDLELPFGNTKRVLEEIEHSADGILKDGKIPFMLGGEHLISLGTFRSIYKQYPEVEVIHFDAHTDLREDYLGESLSHACVMRRIWEIIGDGKIHQFGIRSGEKAEFAFGKEHTCLHNFNLNGLEETIEKLKGKPVYFSLDMDILDPSIFPGTGTPEAGGLTFHELLEGILKMKELRLVGCDVNELSPVYDPSGVSTAVACKIVRELLLIAGTK